MPTPRIPRPVIDRIPPPVVSAPTFQPPVTTTLDPPVIDIPTFEPPVYEPPEFRPDPVVPIPETNSQQEQNEQIESEQSRDLPPQQPPVPGPPPGDTRPEETTGRPIIEAPIIGEVPLPTSSEVALAGTTAIGATAAALLGKSLVEWLVKRLRPIVKKIILKTKEKLGQRFTDYELQQYFELTGEVPKSVAKQLKADQQAEKKKQLEGHLQRQRQNKP